MAKLAVIIPACIQVPKLLEEFRSNIRTIEHDSIQEFIIVCNRLSLMSASSLESLLQNEVRAPVRVLHDKERSVAGAWNRGIEIAMEAGIGKFLITAVDVSLNANSIEQMLAFSDRHPECDIWSSTPQNITPRSNCDSLDACDFSCFMLRKSTIERYGWFDKEYKPAYFEDNDYVTRVVLGGGGPKQVTAARHNHAVSLTIRLDPEMSHHVRHWFGINGARFSQKWGVKTDDYAMIPKSCNRSPYQSGRPLYWWPEQDRPGYSPAGGIHD